MSSPPQDRRAVGLGLAGVLLAFVVLASLHALTVSPFLPADERSHTGYGLVVGRGELPTLTTPAPRLSPPGVGPRIYTANHPPLYYALVAVPLRLGVASGHPMAGLAAARLLTVLMAASGIAALAALALVLSPDRPRLALAAAAAGPLLPSFVHLSGLVHNDALGFTTATVVLAVVAVVLVRGPTAWRLAALAAAAAAAALTRASGLPFAMLAVVAAGLAPLLGGRGRPTLARVGAAAVQAALVAGAVAVTAGWFYLRNRALYGDLAGTAENLRLFGFDARRPLLGVLGSGRFWAGVHDQLWGRMAGGQFLASGALALPGRLLGAAVVAGLVVGGARAVRSRGRAAAATGRPRPAGRAVAWLLVLATVPLMLVAMAGYVAEGGGTHARYLYPALAALSLVAAVGLAELPGRGRPPVLALFVGQVVVNLLLWATFLSRTGAGRPSLAASVGHGLWVGSWAPAGLVVVVVAVLLAAAVAMVARSLRMLDGGVAGMAVPAPAVAAPELARGGP